ncbi:MAG: hypothetical protein K2N78_05270, partial [Oscillospiraceae bacterium]|nr:hypothetical protein [Oscillospiraceae bacterium]
EIASGPRVTLTYFEPDKKKAGGAYVTATGRLRKIDDYVRKLDDYEGVLVLDGGERVMIEDIYSIETKEQETSYAENHIL